MIPSGSRRPGHRPPLSGRAQPTDTDHGSADRIEVADERDETGLVAPSAATQPGRPLYSNASPRKPGAIGRVIARLATTLVRTAAGRRPGRAAQGGACGEDGACGNHRSAPEQFPHARDQAEGMRLSLVEFPADDPQRALRFWSGVLETELDDRVGGRGPRLADAVRRHDDRGPSARDGSRRHGVAALLRRGRPQRGARARPRARRHGHPPRLAVGHLPRLGGQPVRTRR